MKIRIGARGSRLSLVQAEQIKNLLSIQNPQLKIEIIVITTKGDVNMAPVPLDTIGKGWFTKELDKALLTDAIDIAVHSLKDIPEKLPPGLVIAGIPKREDARDTLISKQHTPLAQLRKGAIIGTDSTRRKTQILHKRKDILVKSIRGNINTRLDKLEHEQYDAIILAAAGLKRLGLQHCITEYFDTTDIIPSPGQGALAVVVKKSNTPLYTLIQQLNHSPTVVAVEAERAFLKALGGGCKTPTGAYAVCDRNLLTIHGMVGSPDGDFVIKQKLTGNISQNKKLGALLAKELLFRSKDWYTNEK